MDLETTPLLEVERSGQSQTTHWSRWKVIYICAAFIFFIETPQFIRDAPFLRMLELGVCRDYYKLVDPSMIPPNGDVAEEHCKLPEIQTRLAWIQGGVNAGGILPG